MKFVEYFTQYIFSIFNPISVISPRFPLHPHLASQAGSCSSLNTFLVSICVAQIHLSVRPDLECSPPTRIPSLKETDF